MKKKLKKYVDPFLYDTPELDVHGYDRFGALALIDNFIDNNLRINKKTIIIIHGKGSGILKNETQKYLKKDSRVLNYEVNMFNDGQTIVYLR